MATKTFNFLDSTKISVAPDLTELRDKLRLNRNLVGYQNKLLGLTPEAIGTTTLEGLTGAITDFEEGSYRVLSNDPDESGITIEYDNSAPVVGFYCKRIRIRFVNIDNITNVKVSSSQGLKTDVFVDLYDAAITSDILVVTMPITIGLYTNTVKLEVTVTTPADDKVYVAEIVANPAVYTTDIVRIQHTETVTYTSASAFALTKTIPANTEVQVVCILNNAPFHYNTSLTRWEHTGFQDSFDFSNTEAEVNANIATLNQTGGRARYGFWVLMKTDDNEVTPDISDCTLTGVA